MSTFSLPGYTADAALQTPTYSAEPQLHETTLSRGRPSSGAFALVAVTPPPSIASAEFVKESKRGSLRLRLSGQASDNVAVPVYSTRGPVEGTLELLKTQDLAYVAVRVEGLLKVKEHAGRGTMTTMVCGETLALWSKDVDEWPCPCSLPFSVALPTVFSDERGSWPLPPTYTAHLDGLPGFTASVDYSVTAIASKTKNIKLGIGVTTLSTPFVYCPRARPARGIPPRLEPAKISPGLRSTSEWRTHENQIAARVPGSSSPRDITCKIYTPASHVLCMRRAIPYHITFTGPALALATLLTYLPSRAGAAPGRAYSQIQVLRQASVDVKDAHEPFGATAEMWRIWNIGEGSLYRTGGGPEWLSFAGEISVNSEVTTGGFRAAGLWVKDCIVVSITPPDPHRGPIGDMRCVIPIRLVTDPAYDEGAASVASGVFVPQATTTPSEARGSALANSAGVARMGEDAPEYARGSYVSLNRGR